MQVERNEWHDFWQGISGVQNFNNGVSAITMRGTVAIQKRRFVSPEEKQLLQTSQIILERYIRLYFVILYLFY